MKANKKPRIAVIGLKGLPAFGGAAAVGENIIEQLKDEYDFTVYSTSSHTDKKTGEYNGFRQIVFSKIKFLKLNSVYYNIISSLHVLLFGHYDLVHLHHISSAIVLPLLKLRYRVIITSHGSPFLEDINDTKYSKLFLVLLRFSESSFIKFADTITSVSESYKFVLQEKYKKNVVYIPNGVNVRNLLSKKNDDYIVFASGRIISLKGCHTFLEALIKLNYKKKVLIIGDLDQNRSYKEYINKLASQLNVDFLGLIKNKKELFEIISRSKFFVFPSIKENMSMMLLEVASLKVPLIVSDIPQNKIFNTNEVTFFRVNDVDDLAYQIENVQQNYSSIKGKALLAYKKLENNYKWSYIAQQYETEYNKLIN